MMPDWPAIPVWPIPPELKEAREEIHRLRAENERLRQQLVDQRWQLPNDEIGQLRAEVAKEMERNFHLENENKRLSAENDELIEDRKQGRDEYVRLTEELDRLRADYNELRSAYDRIVRAALAKAEEGKHE